MATEGVTVRGAGVERPTCASAPPPGRTAARVHALRARVRAALGIVRTVLGVPDYERYLEHARGRHPGERHLTREEFYRERLAARYTRPGSRCC